jgi:hypothetical protein
MNRFTAFLFCVLLAATTLASGQSAPEAAPKPSAQPAPDAAPKRCFALNYVLKELDGTRVVNQRSYVLNTFASNTAGGDWTRLRVGNRVPVTVSSGKLDINYLDVGVNIDNRLRESGDVLALDVTAEISSVAPDAGGGLSVAPTVRQVKGTAASLISPGKPSVVFSADDPGSQHRFELQVTATLVR